MSGAPRVLGADDDPIVAAVVADLVRARGDSPRVVHTVVEALAAIA